MTVNERLFHIEALDEWDAAVGRRDRAALMQLLKRIDVSEPQWTVDAVLSNPVRDQS